MLGGVQGGWDVVMAVRRSGLSMCCELEQNSYGSIRNPKTTMASLSMGGLSHDAGRWGLVNMFPEVSGTPSTGDWW